MGSLPFRRAAGPFQSETDDGHDGAQTVMHIKILCPSGKQYLIVRARTTGCISSALGMGSFGVECGRRRTTVRIFLMLSPHVFRASIALSLLFLCTSCAELEKAASDAARTAAASLGSRSAYWNGHRVSGRAKIVVNLGAQRAYLYKGKTLVGESSISTGRKGYETPPGKYRVIQKDEHHVSSIYGDFVDKNGRVVKPNVSAREDHPPPGTRFVGARMPYFLRFTRSYGMHAGFVPRYRASHGCIRMPAEMAKHFFNAAELNMPVRVKE